MFRPFFAPLRPFYFRDPMDEFVALTPDRPVWTPVQKRRLWVTIAIPILITLSSVPNSVSTLDLGLLDSSICLKYSESECLKQNCGWCSAPEHFGEPIEKNCLGLAATTDLFTGCRR